MDTLGPEFTYIVAGDFNSNGPNIPDFDRLKETIQLSDLSKHIETTYEFKRALKVQYYTVRLLIATLDKVVIQSLSCMLNSQRLK